MDSRFFSLCKSFPTEVRSICSKSYENRFINKKNPIFGGRGVNLKKMRLMFLHIHMKNHLMKFGPNPETLTFSGSSESANCQFAFLRF